MNFIGGAYIVAVLLLYVSAPALASHHHQERYEGLYSGKVDGYEVVVPVEVVAAGSRGRRGVGSPRGPSYLVPLGGRPRLVDLVAPPRALVSPWLSLRLPPAATDCHYRGAVRGAPSSHVAISNCHGRLVGFFRMPEGEYWLEPVKSHNSTTGYPHLLYKRVPSQFRHSKKYKNRRRKRRNLNCGTKEPRRSEFNPDLKKKLENKEKDDSIHSHHKRSTVHVEEKYVETLVVADTSMVNFHKDMDLATYLLTIMNMVSSTYQEPSIGHPINIVVVRMIILEDDISEGLNITINADESLKNFCSWQMKQNPTDDDHPNHHDVAILITRKDICARKNTPCSTLGISHIGGMCQPERSCNINEDNGIILAHTITHELGHSFGMYHDTSQAGCEGREGPVLHVMTPNFEADTTHIAWSGCSRRDLNKFLNKGNGYCLKDLPSPTEPQFSLELPPGAMYNADHQCKLQFGSNSSVCCPIDEICSALWCIEDGQCVTNLNPAATGTRCGRKKWCLNQKCVPIEEKPNPINGGWGEWSTWSSCSRSCGGGITMKERQCDNPVPAFGGKFCIGERQKYKVCNSKKCPEDSPSFRSQQCALYNKHTIGTNYTFSPYFEKDDPCHLYCSSFDDPMLEPVGDTVVDGTPCNPGTRDMCINGICRKVGCDWVIDSDSVEDKCGICRGNGSDCITIHGDFDKDNSGHLQQLEIPANSRYINLEEKGNFRNYISIGSLDKDRFFLNGKRETSLTGEFSVGGTYGIYERRKEKEKVFIPGPIKEPIIVYMINRGKGQGSFLKYEYTILKNNKKIVKKYNWVFEWTTCSKTCGGGSQTRLAYCHEVQAQKKVIDDNCERKPIQMTRRCNEFSCATRWWAEPWQPCSVSCGKGTKKRVIRCVSEKNHNMKYNDKACDDNSKPKDSIPCQARICAKKTNDTGNYSKVKNNTIKRLARKIENKSLDNIT